jgi:CHRD domain
MKIYPILLSLILSLLPIAFSQNTVSPVQHITYWLSPVSESGASGNVDFIDYGLGHTLIVINMTGLASGHIYPTHIHSGSCASNGDVVIPLENVGGDSGLSITLTTVPYTEIVNGDYYLNVHQSPENLSSIISCGEIGSQAIATNEPQTAQATTETTAETTTETTLTPGTIEQTGVAQGSTLPTGVKPEEFATRMRTEGYGIFGVNGNNVYGQIQVAEEADGTARVIVTLNNIQRGDRYPLEVFQGDCGPDRLSLVKLNDVPSVPADPTASATYTSLSYDQIAESNNFIYVYALDGTVLACGEVGSGANR